MTLISRPGATALMARSSAVFVPFHQQPRRVVEVAAAEGAAVVAVDAVLERRHVDLHQVALLEGARVGDAVTDDLVHRRTDRLREAAVVEG